MSFLVIGFEGCVGGSLNSGWVRSIDRSRLFLLWGFGGLHESDYLEGVGLNDFTTGGGDMEWCLTDGEDGAEEEGPILLQIDDVLLFLQLMYFFGLFEALFVFQSLVSDMFDRADRGIALGTGRANGAVCVFTRVGSRGQRFRCLKLPFGLTNDMLCPFFILRNRTKAFRGTRTTK